MTRTLWRLPIVVPAVVLLFLLVLTVSSSAAPPGDNGPIVYTSDTGLHVINADGSDQDLVVSGTFVRPDVSPDGTAVLVTELESEMDTSGPLVAIDLATATRTVVVETPVDAGVWSGDGTQIAYADEGGLWILTGESAENISETHDTVFDWSPVDDRIIVARSVDVVPPEYYFETIDAATGEVETLRDNGPGLFTWYVIDADFSPDGEDIVYSSVTPGDISIVVYGEENAPYDSTGVYGGPSGPVAWSPDGTTLTYATHVQGPTGPQPVLAVHPVGSDSRTELDVSARGLNWAPLRAREVGFRDVPHDHLFRADIVWLAGQDITRGCNPPTNDRFCPDDFVTRAQMAAFLVRAFGYSDDGGGDLFTDDDGSVFERDIDRLATANVTRGCNPPTNDRFCPDDFVTRAQMAAFLHRAIGG